MQTMTRDMVTSLDEWSGELASGAMVGTVLS
jgi:hypothetical protein